MIALGDNWTVRKVLSWTRDYFAESGIPQPRLEAEILLAHALAVDRLHLYLSPEKPLSEEERNIYRTLVTDRQRGVPLQLLTKEVSFLGLRFKVDHGIFIPRSETEELVELVLRRTTRDRELACLDLGTGTGVIAVCLAKFLASSRVVAIDSSSEALALAAQNAQLHGVSERIIFVQSNWFSSVYSKFDLIVTNPPYIIEDRITTLSKEVRDHDPHIALSGGEDGLKAITTIIDQVPQYVNSGALLAMEVGNDQAEQISKKLCRIAGISEVKTVNDITGKERFVLATWQ
ncbi:peptide chain release factor N(5)-glutamine methyltransferase [Candidatus Acetothermia bacterium]|nr:peptide chain release factor N(5)-glutamine methyltransferase [Candidatus Acetothermia bacterium]